MAIWSNPPSKSWGWLAALAAVQMLWTSFSTDSFETSLGISPLLLLTQASISDPLALTQLDPSFGAWWIKRSVTPAIKANARTTETKKAILPRVDCRRYQPRAFASGLLVAELCDATA